MKKTLIALSIMACMQPVLADEPVFSVGDEAPVESQMQEPVQDQVEASHEQSAQPAKPAAVSEEYVFDPNAEPQGTSTHQQSQTFDPQPAAPISRPMGPLIREKSSSLKPSAESLFSRAPWVRLLPKDPM